MKHLEIITLFISYYNNKYKIIELRVIISFLFSVGRFWFQ